MRSRHGSMFDAGAWHRGFGGFILRSRPEGAAAGDPGTAGAAGAARARAGATPNVRPAVLALLLERPMHGYEMIQELESRTGGIWRRAPARSTRRCSCWRTRASSTPRSTAAASASSSPTPAAPRPRRPRRTPPGRVQRREHVQVQEFRDAAVGIMDALRQVGFNGTAEQRAQALEVLNETRRKLYAILAD